MHVGIKANNDGRHHVPPEVDLTKYQTNKLPIKAGTYSRLPSQ